MIRLTRSVANRAVAWFRAMFGMEDWSFVVQVDGDPPGWVEASGNVAEVSSDVSDKTADIWVSNKRADNQGRDPLAVLFHECGHPWLRDLTVVDANAPSASEYGLNQLGIVCALAFRAQGKKRCKK